MLRIGSLSQLFLLVLVGITPSWSHAAGTPHPAIGKAVICTTPQCHARLLEAATGARVGSVHQPAADGECVSCHDLALPSGASFVKGAPSGDAGSPEASRAWDLALCSGCHGEGLFAPNGPATATGFADGKRNLHMLHVQAGRGRRCLPCHGPHVSRQPKLLRERIPTRGKAQISQEFRGEPKGGWCKTGCHAPKSYERSPG
jgi:predicted CXXCH cytochrome family protein